MSVRVTVGGRGGVDAYIVDQAVRDLENPQALQVLDLLLVLLVEAARDGLELVRVWDRSRSRSGLERLMLWSCA